MQLGHSLHVLVAATCLLSSAAAELVELWWDISETRANPDGLHERTVIGVNGSWPPPLVQVTTDDFLSLHVRNLLKSPVSIHHHGLFFNGSAFYDGAVGATECGIPPGSSFTYEVAVNASGQWGTYWWHAHSHGHYIDGLRAPFIIHPISEQERLGPSYADLGADRAEAYEYDDDYTIVLGDWYHESHHVLQQRFISKSNPTGAEPVPDSPLLYIYRTPAPTSAAAPKQITKTTPTIAFEPGKKYRFRIVNTSAFAMFFFWIDGHDMSIIEADGTDTEPFPTSLVAISAAQRYSILVEARKDSNLNYLIHAVMDETMFDDPPASIVTNTSAIIQYSSSSPTFPSPSAPQFEEFDDTALVPLAQLAPPDPSRRITLIAEFETMDDGTNRGMFNSTMYMPPLVPALLTQVTTGPDATDPDIYTSNSFVLAPWEVVEVEVVNLDDGSHPFHLHGHRFWIVGRSDEFDGATKMTQSINPLRRDTVQIPGGGSVVIRFVADNPGAWMFHCHIEWHLESGLAVVFNSAPLLSQATLSPPSKIASNCAALGLPTSGNAAGRTGTDLTGLPRGPKRQVLGWTPKAIAAISGCIGAALLGMGTVGWYALGPESGLD